MTDARPILYSFRRCPYAMRGRMALDAAAIVLEHREILLKDKPAEMLAASPKGTVPVVVLPDGVVLEESLDVMNWALDQHDPEGWRAPADEADSAALIAANDGAFKHHLDRYKYAARHEGAVAEDHRTAAAGFLDELEARLSQSPQLFGDAPRFADFAIFPFIRQYAHTDLDWFKAQPWPGVQRWLNDHLSSARFHRIMAKHALFVSDTFEKNGTASPVRTGDL